MTVFVSTRSGLILGSRGMNGTEGESNKGHKESVTDRRNGAGTGCDKVEMTKRKLSKADSRNAIGAECDQQEVSVTM